MFFKPKKVIEILTEDIINSIPVYLLDVKFKEHILYHRSPFNIVKYEHSYAVKIRKERSTHDNSVLGMWTSTRPALCDSFGEFNYKVNNTKKLKYKGIDFRLFYYLTSKLKIKDLLILRESIMKECDILYLMDATKQINEVIVLNTEAITITKVSNKLLDEFYDLKLK